MKLLSFLCVLAISGLGTLALLLADPCGMVPPIYVGNKPPISRTGLQQTYVFHDQGMETFVIRPGFQGDIDNFGMLIPFPNPPTLRKVPDDIFSQIKNSIDPPEVVVYAGRHRDDLSAGGGAEMMMEDEEGLSIQDKVRVVKQEAVGMYEVAVLEAGSAKALKTWMDDNGYQYPDGMDKVAEEYIEQNWCFVAVKTKVQDKAKADPQPGQRRIEADLKPGASFGGHVQGLGFRFQSEKLVVPMRLSAFNEGELRNIVYLLTSEPKRIRSIPEEYVMRQISGRQLYNNLTKPLPLRVIGGELNRVPEFERRNLKERRKPGPHNGLAKLLYTSDIKAANAVADSGLYNEQAMLLEHEALEKDLLAIGERFGLRGQVYDSEIHDAVADSAEEATRRLMKDLRKFTLTVVDGDFPREVIANENLTFANYSMPKSRNSAKFYDAKIHKPADSPGGRLYSSLNPWSRLDDVSQDTSTNHVVLGENKTRSRFALLMCSLFISCSLIALWRGYAK